MPKKSPNKRRLSPNKRRLSPNKRRLSPNKRSKKGHKKRSKNKRILSGKAASGKAASGKRSHVDDFLDDIGPLDKIRLDDEVLAPPIKKNKSGWSDSDFKRYYDKFGDLGLGRISVDGAPVLKNITAGWLGRMSKDGNITYQHDDGRFTKATDPGIVLNDYDEIQPPDALGGLQGYQS